MGEQQATDGAAHDAKDLFGPGNEEYEDTDTASPYPLQLFLDLQRQHIRVSEAREQERLERKARLQSQEGKVEQLQQQQQQVPQGRFSPLPKGWLDCPEVGEPIELLVPCKVPLGVGWNRYIPQEKRFTPRKVFESQLSLGRQIGLVIDLTNSENFYHPSEWEELNVKHYKIYCRGHGYTPEELKVNEFVHVVKEYFAVQQQMVQDNLPPQYCLVHCTHGFNRTGFMIAHFLQRQFAKPISFGVRAFAHHRPPGIYKELYLSTLFSYYFERRPTECTCPALPEWKTSSNHSDSDDDDDQDKFSTRTKDQEAEQGVSETISHSDLVGEEVPEDYVNVIQASILNFLGVDPNNRRFPGSQPVSLAQANIQLLEERAYRVTWKADGTRYMLFILMDGSYLIDRKFNVRRVQMRFPVKLKQMQVGHPFDTPTHHFTLLDGEMVVDRISESKYQRRYLVYDIMVLRGVSVIEKPFRDRLRDLMDQLIMPRKHQDPIALDRELKATGSKHVLYDYNAEGNKFFRVRLKDFFPLAQTRNILSEKFKKSLTHECDGLIFQGWEDPYVLWTCNELLKWKYAHMNSVDFLLKLEGPNKDVVDLYVMKGAKGRQNKTISLESLRSIPGAVCKIRFDGGESVNAYEDKIVECSWDPAERTWVFMRDRPDKDTPNALSVYHKVMQSIQDDINDERMIRETDKAWQTVHYQAERDKYKQQMAQSAQRRAH
eukprot:scaffold3423_cov379-Prasinococcus_capsulatus_cf.AAC.2